MLKSLIIFDNVDSKILFQTRDNEFLREHQDIVIGFLKAIDDWASQYSGKGADVFQTESLRITFKKSQEFNLTFASCTDLSDPLDVDKEHLETIKYAFIHSYWELFTSDKRKNLTDEDKEEFKALLESI
ncbi:MAG: hypothetical protein ACFFCS_07630 [Candidatus Hodarchaeota archaeon]